MCVWRQHIRTNETTTVQLAVSRTQPIFSLRPTDGHTRSQPTSHLLSEVSHAVWRYFLRFAASSDFHFTITSSAGLLSYSATFPGAWIQQLSNGSCSEPVLSILHPYTLLYKLKVIRGPGSSVGIATGCGMGSPGIESRWGRDFPHLSRPALVPTQSPVQWLPGPSRE
jgi:hypothetical protein